ncbi:hypothetical protein PFLUV_G00075950 [Perca fluviatilis]|uniref:Uncharacterized protein n=1 Tax=Perca fluviatilis TaxID=8168 RepID=A0A6A5F4K4_PERFL|nr:hypothetical protein PFLUV_G00075950 [Perca fluviatilis]
MQDGRRGDSPSSLSPEDNEPSSTRKQEDEMESPLSSSSRDNQPSPPRRQQAWVGESPLSSEDEEPSTTSRQQEQRSERPLSSAGINLATTSRLDRGLFVSLLASVGKDLPSNLMQDGGSPSLSSEDDEPSSTRRQQEEMGESPSSSSQVHVQRGERPLSRGDFNPSTTLRQDGRRGDRPASTSSSSEDDEPSATRRQQERRANSPLPIYLRVRQFLEDSRRRRQETERQDIEKWERKLRMSEYEYEMKYRQLCLETRKQIEREKEETERQEKEKREREDKEIIEREKQRLEEKWLRIKRVKREDMEKKNQEKERKTFGLLSRIYIWWFSSKMDKIAIKIASNIVAERKLMSHGPLRNPWMLRERERLVDRRTKLVVSFIKQHHKLLKEEMKQRLKIDSKKVKVWRKKFRVAATGRQQQHESF